MATAEESTSKPLTLGEVAAEGFAILEVGPERKKYHIHRALLIHHSECFRKALQGPWKEAQEGVFKFEDIEPAVVNIFVHWLYTNTLSEPDDQNEKGHILATLKAYIFADRFFFPEFRRAANNNFVDLIQSNVVGAHDMLDLAKEAFANIPSNRPILQLIVDDHCAWWSQCCDNNTDLWMELPPAFLVRAMRRLQEKFHREKIDQKEKGGRCYLEHASDKEQKVCQYRHMQYDKEKDFGFFGERLTCSICSDHEV